MIADFEGNILAPPLEVWYDTGMDLTSLIGKPLKLPSGKQIGIITGAHTDKTGIVIKGTVQDPKIRKLLELPSHEEASRG